MDNLTNTDDIDILIVEDSPTQAEELRFILDKRGYTVSLAVDGKEALRFLAIRIPDIVVTDIVMPEMDGYELCRQIRSDRRLKDVPVILVTSLSEPADVIKGLEAGANNFITKPYDEKYILSRIQYLIANREIRKNSMASMGINVYFSGENYFITAERLQILDLLLSTYENAYHQNRDLLTIQMELRELNEHLEDIVAERTAELSAANQRLNIELEENKRTGEEKAKLQAQLYQAQKMESVGQLAGGVAHDFNNMLSVILGYSQLALEKTEPSSTLRGDLQEILDAALRSVNITRQLLAFARKQTISPQVLDLNETVEGMLKMLRRLIGEDVNLEWLPEPKLWQIMIDPSQIDQILANLCINARDAIAGVGKIIIETGTAAFETEYCASHPGVSPGEFVVLAVSDDGSGMEKELLDKIFEPFFTTKEIGQGTGLGLSTVYGIVQQNNGFINVYSEPGKGTTFRVYLPRHIGENGRKEKLGNGETHLGHGETVLVVEDEAAILRLTSRILTDLGYTVLTANKPLEAVELARQHAIDLLLTDVIMPEMNGKDLAEQLVALHPNLKCLLMSGYTANVIASHGVLDEGIHFIQKPFSAKSLAAKVRETLES
jgi:signal transduction histidine kinase